MRIRSARTGTPGNGCRRLAAPRRMTAGAVIGGVVSFVFAFAFMGTFMGMVVGISADRAQAQTRAQTRAQTQAQTPLPAPKAGSQATRLPSSDALRLDATAYKPWPKTTAIALDVMDNSDRNLALLAALRDAMTAKGYRIDPKAALVLTLDSREENGAWSDAGERTFLELRATGGPRGGGDASARINIFDSARGGLVNAGQRAPERVTPTRIVYQIMISSRDKDEHIWQAWAKLAPRAAQASTADAAIAGEIVGNFGKTVRNRVFPIR